MTLTAFLAAVLAVAVSLTAMPSQSAPLDGKDLPATPPGSVMGLDPATPLPTTGGSGGNGASAVELLLQMQNQPAAQPTPDRRPQSSSTTTPAAAKPARDAASSPLVELKSSLLGQGSSLAGAAEPPRDDRIDAVARAEGSSDYAGPRNGAASARGDDGGLLANPVIRFIRDHRELAIGGSLGLLVAVWLTANYRGGRQRRR